METASIAVRVSSDRLMTRQGLHVTDDFLFELILDALVEAGLKNFTLDRLGDS